MKVKKILVSLLIVCVVGACKSNDGAGKFQTSQYLAADSIAIKEVLNPQSVAMTDFYAIISSPKSQKVMYRYSIPDWTFMDTTFSKGQGPEDMEYPTFLKNNKPNENVWIFDNNKVEIRCLHLSPEDVTNVKTIKSRDVINNVYAWYGAVVNDKYLIDSRLNRETRETMMYCYDLSDSLRTKDSVNTLAVSTVVEQQGGWSATTTNSPNVFIYGGRMMFYYNMLDNAQKYKITSAGGFELEKVYGHDYLYDEVKNMDMENLNKKKTSYTRALASDENYIYLLRVSFSRNEDANAEKGIEITKTAVEVYSWDMEPVKEFILNKTSASNVSVDIANKKIYAWDSELDFDKVYVYDMNL